MKEEKKKFSKDEIIKLLLIFGIIVIIVVYLILTSGNVKKFELDESDIDIDKLFLPIKDNYTLEIEKNIENENEIIDCISDGDLKLYNKKNDNNGYLVYNDKVYFVEEKNAKIKEIKNKPIFMDENFLDINYIKSFMKKCVIKNLKINSFDCHIDVSDYIDNFNSYFNTHYNYDGTDQIIFNVTYGDIINSFKVDYTKINGIISSGENLEYNIKILNVNSNNYSNLLNVFEKELKK